MKQSMVALSLANEVRLAHADYRKRLRAGDLTIRQVVELPHADRMTVFSLFRAPMWAGKGKAGQVCRAVGISEVRRWGELTERQRDILLGIADEWAKGSRTVPMPAWW